MVDINTEAMMRRKIMMFCFWNITVLTLIESIFNGKSLNLIDWALFVLTNTLFRYLELVLKYSTNSQNMKRLSYIFQ